jgi:hypothetical protein
MPSRTSMRVTTPDCGAKIRAMPSTGTSHPLMCALRV